MKGSIAFAVGTGRCGTNFLAKVLKSEPEIASSHERSPLNDTFHRFFKWNDLPIDHAGFLNHKQDFIIKDLETAKFSFESSAYLSLSVQELYEHFDAKFILLIRSPDKVINSYLNKSWYDQPIIRTSSDLPISFQGNIHFHHFLGRIVPNGQFFQEWNNYTRVGKLAWYWNALNKRVIQQFEDIPADRQKIIKIEDFDFNAYQDLIQFLGCNNSVDQDLFNKIRSSKPNARNQSYSVSEWNEIEKTEFMVNVIDMAKVFNYEFSPDRLIAKEDSYKTTDSEQRKSKPKKRDFLNKLFFRK